MDPQTFAQLSANAEANYAARTPRQQMSDQMTQQQKKKPWWTSGISEAAGLAGGVGGFLVGGPVGAVAGATALGGLGNALEQKVRDNKVDWGKAAKGAAIEGITTAGPLKLAKGAVMGGKALAKGAGTIAARDAASSAYGTSLLSKTGQKLTATASGLNQSGKLFESQTDRNYANMVNKVVGLKGSAANKFNNIDEAISKVGAKADTVLANTKQQANALDLLAQMKAKGNKAIVGDRAAYERAQAEAGQQLLSLQKNGKISASDLMGFKRDVSERLGGSFKKLQNGTALTPEEQAFMDVWSGIDSQITKLAPAAKTLTKAQSTLIKERAVLDKAQNATTGGSVLGTSLPKRTTTRIVQGGTDLLGRTMQSAGNPTIKSVATRSLIGGALGGSGNDVQTATANPQSLLTKQPAQDATSSLLGQANAGGDVTSQLLGQPQQQTQGGPSLASLQQAIQEDIQSTGGKNINNLMQLAQLYGIVDQQGNPASAGGSKPLNSTAAGVVADTTTGLNALGELYNSIGSSNVNNPVIGQLRGLNPFDTNAQNLQAQIATTKQIVGKALEGGVLRKEDESKYAKILPKLGDTDAVAQYKVQQLYGLISQRLNEYKSSLGGGGGGVDTNSLLSQLNGAQ